jgi:hypothetical protein
MVSEMGSPSMSETEEPKEKTSSKTGNFFAVDRRIIDRLCSSGMVNPVVAYLVIACGTGRDQQTSKWSAKAITQYSQIKRTRAKEAIEYLIRNKYIEQLKEGKFPLYRLRSYDELQGKKVVNPAQLTKSESIVLKKFSSNLISKLTPKQTLLVPKLHEKGWLKSIGNYPPQYILKTEEELKHKHEWIWLPNEVVVGTKKKETPPLDKLRAATDPLLIQLFLDMYNHHDLSDDGGLSRLTVSEVYECEKLTERGIYAVWGFSSPGKVARRNFAQGHFELENLEMLEQFDDEEDEPTDEFVAETWKPFWDRLELIESMGLIEFVPHVFQGDTDEAEVIFSYGLKKPPQLPEDYLGPAAQRAGRVLLEEAIQCGCKSLEERGDGVYEMLVALPKSQFPKVMVHGIGRLLYRPKTKKTSQWFAELHRSSKKWTEAYEALVNERISQKKVVGF